MDKYERRRQNLIELMHQHCNGKAARLAEKIEVSASYASRMLYEPEKAGAKRIGEDMVERIETAFALPRGVLDEPTGPLEAIPGAMRVVIAEPGDPDFYEIPKVQLVLSAGMTGFQTVPEIYDGSKLSISKNWVDRHGYVPGRLIAIRVKGDSMEPNLYEGDQVIINTADTRMEDGAVFAVNFEGQAVVKRLSRDRGEWWLTSDNPDQVRHRRKSCREGECIIIGRIVKRETDRI